MAFKETDRIIRKQLFFYFFFFFLIIISIYLYILCIILLANLEDAPLQLKWTQGGAFTICEWKTRFLARLLWKGRSLELDLQVSSHHFGGYFYKSYEERILELCDPICWAFSITSCSTLLLVIYNNNQQTHTQKVAELIFVLYN